MENKTVNVSKCNSSFSFNDTRNKIMDLLDWGLTEEDKMKTADKIIKNKDSILSMFLD